MKKIQCEISDQKMKFIDGICQENGYTYAEFTRRAIDFYIGKSDSLEYSSDLEQKCLKPDKSIKLPKTSTIDKLK